MRGLYLVVFLFSGLALFVAFNFSSPILKSIHNKTPTLRIWVNQDPFSTDPYDFDLGVHYLLDGPIYLKLASSYKDSMLSPSAAESWRSFDSERTWEFVIRSGLTFSNGEMISSEDVANSFKRIFLLAKKNHSSLPLMHEVLGIDQLENMNSHVSGISTNGNRLVLKFTKPEPALVEKLSFGLYSIVNHVDFDSKTGKWISKIPVSSGPYKLDRIDFEKKYFLFSLREDTPEILRLKNAFKEVRVSWDKELRASAQITEGNSGEDPPSPSFTFKGETESDVIYLQCVSWMQPRSPLHLKRNRILARETFYGELEKSGLHPIRSLYPLNLPGVSEFPRVNPEVAGIPFAGRKITIIPSRNGQVVAYRNIRSALETTFTGLGAVVNTKPPLPSVEYRAIVTGKNSNSGVDILARSTSIGNEDPRETTQLMFSAEGINLPDSTGSIHEKVRSGVYTLDKINHMLFEDAIVWPVLHYSEGFWVNGEVDVSRYNQQWPLSEIQWIAPR
ncbi:MAG: ABC transporter substrate-binding protein [Bdellovibrionota bacterium]